MLLSFHTHSDSFLRKLSFAKVIEKVFSSVLRPEGKRRRLRDDVSRPPMLHYYRYISHRWNIRKHM